MLEPSCGDTTGCADAVAPVKATEPPTKTANFAAMELRKVLLLSDTFPPFVWLNYLQEKSVFQNVGDWNTFLKNLGILQCRRIDGWAYNQFILDHLNRNQRTEMNQMLNGRACRHLRCCVSIYTDVLRHARD